MKNLTKLTFSFLFILLITSCDKSNLENDLPQDQTNINAVLALKNENAQKLAFTTILNPSEKLTLWKNKIEKDLNENNFSYNQKKIIKEMLSLLKINIFNNDKASLITYRNQEIIWRNKALKVFTEQELKSLFSSLNSYKSNTSNFTIQSIKTNEIKTMAAGDCVCNRVSDYCSSAEGDCVSSRCESQSGGCGTFFLYDCNGYCSNMKSLLP